MTNQANPLTTKSQSTPNSVDRDSSRRILPMLLIGTVVCLPIVFVLAIIAIMACVSLFMYARADSRNIQDKSITNPQSRPFETGRYRSVAGRYSVVMPGTVQAGGRDPSSRLPLFGNAESWSPDGCRAMVQFQDFSKAPEEARKNLLEQAPDSTAKTHGGTVSKRSVVEHGGYWGTEFYFSAKIGETEYSGRGWVCENSDWLYTLLWFAPDPTLPRASGDEFFDSFTIERPVKTIHRGRTSSMRETR